MASIAITLTWKNQSTKLDGINIYRDIQNLDTSNLPVVYATLDKTATSFQDTDVQNSMTYYYVIGTVRGSNEVYSTQQSFTTSAIELGPGPQVLMGYNDAYAGFFGETLPSDLITGTALTTMVGLTTGTNKTDIDTISWLKFALDDKILFVSKRSLKYNISWSALQSYNIVDGSRIITIGTYQYKIRLLKGIRPDTTGIVWKTGVDPEITWGSEWNRLMYNLLPPDSAPYTQDSQVGADWADYSADNIGQYPKETIGRNSWCQESAFDTSQNSPISRGYRALTVLYTNTSTTVNTDLAWRPCLELVTQ